jgi:hypothetical protein
LIARGGNLYGTTAGFNKQYGTVFELTPQKNGTWVFKLLYKFTGGVDGAYPQPGLVFDKAGNLYGTTQVGGVNACDWTVPNTCGTVFELTPTAKGLWNEKVLYSFPGSGGPSIPNTGLISDSSGNLYGATNAGGTHFDDGTVFKLTQQLDGTWTEQQLYAFSSSYGIWVKGTLTLDSAGNVYGTTLLGGNGSSCEDSGTGCGNIFELSPVPTGGWTYSLLYTFCSLANCADGGYPNGDLLDVGGNLYGTTSSGAVDFTDGGTAFELVRTGVGKWTYDVLYTFCSLPGCADGSRPSGGLVRDASGNLYGATVVGGTGANGKGGTVFKLSPSGGTYTLQSLYDFCQSQNCLDGSEPTGRLTLDKVGNIYGTTPGGGSKDTGVVFQIVP